MKLIFACACLTLLMACKNGPLSDMKEINPSFGYQIIEAGPDEFKGKPKALIQLNAQILTLSDSALKHPYLQYPIEMEIAIPDTARPNSLGHALIFFNQGDSGIIRMVADSLFKLPYLRTSMPENVDSSAFVSIRFRVTQTYTADEWAAELAYKDAEAAALAHQQFKRYLQELGVPAHQIGNGVHIQVNKPGKGAYVKYGQTVRIQYTMLFMDGTVIETTDKLGIPFDFVVGSQDAIAGLSEAVLKLQKGSKAMVVIPAHLAHGAKGYPPVIPPHTPLVYSLEIVDIMP